MEKHLISVVMPTYNCEKYIHEAIDSILNQTYKNFEFIIVDGHSNDGTEIILEDYKQKDQRVKIIYDNGKGIGAALRLGCENANGDYIARMDSDDISLPQRLENEMKVMLSDDNNILVSCASIYIDGSGNNIGYGFPYTSRRMLKRNVTSILHPGVLMRKDAYVKAGGYQSLLRAEDFLLWSRMIKYGKFSIVKYPLVKYRLLPNSLTNSMSDFFNDNFPKVYRSCIDKEKISFDDIQEINAFIKRETMTGIVVERNPIRKSENKLFEFLRLLLPELWVFSILLSVKNWYGYFFHKSIY